VVRRQHHFSLIFLRPIDDGVALGLGRLFLAGRGLGTWDSNE
jgi:hypothetical protein